MKTLALYLLEKLGRLVLYLFNLLMPKEEKPTLANVAVLTRAQRWELLLAEAQKVDNNGGERLNFFQHTLGLSRKTALCLTRDFVTNVSEIIRNYDQRHAIMSIRGMGKVHYAEFQKAVEDFIDGK